MKVSTTRIVQAVLIVAIAAAAIRLVWVFRGRASEPATVEKKNTTAPPLPPEAYVVPERLHIASLKSAQQLVGKTVWVKEGYRYSVFPYDRTVDFKHPAGLLLPLQKIEIKKVAVVPSEHARQVVAVFDESGKSYAVPIGVESGGDLNVYADEMFYYQDPQQLYSFWPGDVWDAIHKHEVKNGMNEYQVTFAVGMGIPEPGSGQEHRVVQYPNGGNPLVVTYQNGRVVEIKKGS